MSAGKPKVNPNAFPIWRDTFDDATRAKQLSDDSQAWHHVTALLLLIVCSGVCLSLMTVFITSRYM